MDGVQPPVAELPIGGTPRKVIMQAPKNGFLYVIDRTDGRLISAEKIVKATWADPAESNAVRAAFRASAALTSGAASVSSEQAARARVTAAAGSRARTLRRSMRATVLRRPPCAAPVMSRGWKDSKARRRGARRRRIAADYFGG